MDWKDVTIQVTRYRAPTVMMLSWLNLPALTAAEQQQGFHSEQTPDGKPEHLNLRGGCPGRVSMRANGLNTAVYVRERHADIPSLRSFAACPSSHAAGECEFSPLYSKQIYGEAGKLMRLCLFVVTAGLSPCRAVKHQI